MSDTNGTASAPETATPSVWVPKSPDDAVFRAIIWTAAEYREAGYVDERELAANLRLLTGLDPLTIGQLHRRCEREVEGFAVHYLSRWNAAGEPIGPAIYLNRRDALIWAHLAQHMRDATDAFFDGYHEDPDAVVSPQTLRNMA